ncbi:MAG TPA: TetR/AcrR family transcriptional regulator [Patescibacteria group bacterium]|nr:TetR/AcrR family transcriptional regulator [Patescibacteria group bacterium]
MAFSLSFFMRYTPSHKVQTRIHIIGVASRLFKEQGIDATGIAVVMKEAGLTNGAFYTHFDSKEALVEAVVADQLQKQIESFQQVPKDISGVKTIISLYLTTEHRDNCGEGCPSAALLDEIGRRSTSTKQAYSSGMLLLVDGFQEHFPHLSAEDTRALVFALISLLIGTMQLSRAMTDKNTSNFVLENGKKAAFALVDAS